MTPHEIHGRELREITQSVGRDVRRFNGKTVLLTGSNGFLGRYFQAFFAHLNRAVLSSPCRLIAVDNHIIGSSASSVRKLSSRFTNLNHDITRPLRIKEPIHYVLHAAGIASPFYYRKFPLETLDVATVGTRNMLRLALEKQVEGFLFFSSSEIYGDPDPSHVPTQESYRGHVACLGPRACYDESKRVGETLCYVFHGMHGVKAKIVRPFNVYGPGMHQADYRVLPNFAHRALTRQPLNIYGNGKQTRTFCYISDSIAGFIKALLIGVPGEAYNIGNTDPEINMVDLALLLGKVLRRKLPVKLIEYPDAYPPDEPMRRCPDLTKARTQLNYEPRVDLREGLSRFMKWATKTYPVEKHPGV